MGVFSGENEQMAVKRGMNGSEQARVVAGGNGVQKIVDDGVIAAMVGAYSVDGELRGDVGVKRVGVNDGTGGIKGDFAVGEADFGASAFGCVVAGEKETDIDVVLKLNDCGLAVDAVFAHLVDTTAEAIGFEGFEKIASSVNDAHLADPGWVGVVGEIGFGDVVGASLGVWAAIEAKSGSAGRSVFAGEMVEGCE